MQDLQLKTFSKAEVVKADWLAQPVYRSRSSIGRHRNDDYHAATFSRDDEWYCGCIATMSLITHVSFGRAFPSAEDARAHCESIAHAIVLSLFEENTTGSETGS